MNETTGIELMAANLERRTRPRTDVEDYTTRDH